MNNKRRRFLLGSNALLVTLMTIVILGVLYQLADRYRFQFDLSTDNVNTLQPDTLAKLQLLDQDGKAVEIIAFTSQEGRRDAYLKNRFVRDFLKKIDRNSTVISSKQIDYDRERLTAEKLGVKEYGRIVIKRGDARVDLRERSLFHRTGRGVDTKLRFKGEDEFSRAFSQIMSDKKQVVYFLQGHGEPDIKDASPTGIANWVAQMSVERYESKVLNLMQAPRGSLAPSVPADAMAVVIIRPQTRLETQEENLLLDYASRGGSIFLLTDVGRPHPQFLERLGIGIAEGVALDRNALFPYWDRPIPQALPHDITKDIIENKLSVVLAHPAPMVLADKPPKGVRLSPLLRLSRDGWVELGEREEGGTPRYDEGIDLREAAPLLVAVQVYPSSEVLRGGKESSRMVIASDSDWLNNELFRGGNRTLAASIMHWLAADERRLRTKVSRQTELRSLSIPKPQLPALRFFSLVPMPLFAFGIGFIVWWSRRGR